MKNRERPRPQAMVGIDPDNAYARLGVSPTASTDEIKTFVDTRIAEIKAAMRDHPSREKEEALARLSEVGKLIGTPRARLKYHEANPWNELLAVQRAPADEALDPGARTGLVTAALLLELGPFAALPSARSFDVWAPSGISEALAAELQAFLRTSTDDRKPSPQAPSPQGMDEAQLSVDELHPSGDV